MISNLKPYPTMKDSGLRWLGRVPVGWESRRNGCLFSQRNDTGFARLPILEVSIKTGVRVRNFESSARKQVMADAAKYKRACKGDIAYNMMRMWQGAVGAAPTDGLVSPAYIVARPLPEIESRYYEYLFRMGAYTDQVNQFSRGIVSDRNRLYWEDFKQMSSPVPPFAEQVAIVNFLDHVDRRIRCYIRAKQKLIKLLEEQKQAITHHAVTRGLNPNVRLKPSGVEWLGDVPEHWEVLPLRRRCIVIDCKHVTVPFVDDGIPLASVREVQGFELELDKAKRTTPDWFEKLIEGDRKPRVGDIIYCRNVSVGASALVSSDTICAMGQDVCLIRTGENARYLNYFLNSSLMNQQLALVLVGSTFVRINVSEVKSLMIIFPPKVEQRAIAEYLDDSMRMFDVPIAAATREVALLREYRTRLIADVVTGKLDVREAAGRLPDELPEPATAETESDMEQESEEGTAESLEEVEM